MTEHERERRKQRYKNMTADERQKRRDYQSAWMRKHRAAAKASNTVQAAPVTLTEQAPVHAIKDDPEPISAQPKRSKEVGPRKARRAWRSSVVDYLQDCLTDPACPMTGECYESHRIGSMWLGFYDRLNQIESTVDDRPDVLAELRLSIAIEALRRLSGETPAGKGSCATGNRTETGLGKRLGFLGRLRK
jgi:hypothetical protein